jgi:hypothetical protein
MKYRKRNEDPAYLQAMREAKELFDAEMAKAAMKRKGRPPKAKVAAVEVEDDEVGADLEVIEVIEEAPPPPPSRAKAKKG